MRIIECVWILALAAIGKAQVDKGVTGLIGQDITLECDLAITDSTRVMWVDWVYNTGRDPMDIYDSTRGTVNTDHLNVANFMVNPDYSLTIKNLKLNGNGAIGDSGEYICQTIAEDGTEEEYAYQLDVSGLPECSDDVVVSEGEATKLECAVSFSGSFPPELKWYRDDEEIDSVDMSSIGTTQKDVEIDNALWSMDGSTFTCRLSLNELQEDCSLKMTVKHKVRDLKLTPESGSARVDDEVMCSASGNPEPRIEFEVTGASLPQEMEQPGSRSFKIPKSWQGQEVEIKCSASNTLEDQVEILTASESYTIIDEREKTTEEMQAETTASTTTTEEVVVTKKRKPKTTPEKEREPTTTVAAPTDPKTSTGSTNVAGIVAAVVIVALVVVVIVIAIVCIKRKNSNKPKGHKPVPTKEEEVRALESGKA